MNHQNIKHVLDYIKANPDKYNRDRGFGHTGDTHCFVATAAILAGVWDGKNIPGKSADEHIEDVQDYMGLSVEQLWRLYQADSLPEIEEYLKEWGYQPSTTVSQQPLWLHLYETFRDRGITIEDSIRLADKETGYQAAADITTTT